MANTNGKLGNDWMFDEAGIKISLGNDQWIQFAPDGWTIDQSIRFRAAADTLAFRMVVEQTSDWNIRDNSGAQVQFQREAILAGIDLLEGKPIDPEKLGTLTPFVPSIPNNTFFMMVQAYYRAIAASRNLPLVRRSNSTA